MKSSCAAGRPEITLNFPASGSCRPPCLGVSVDMCNVAVECHRWQGLSDFHSLNTDTFSNKCV